MTRYRALLDDEIGTPPPSRVDIDDIIGRQRQWRRHRRLGIGCAGAAVLLAVVPASVVLSRGDGTGPPGQPARPAASSTATPGPPSTRDATATRMTEALTQAMAELLPDAEFLPNRTPGEERVDALVFDALGENEYTATAKVQDAAGVGSIEVTVQKDPPFSRAEFKCYEDQLPLDVDEYNCKMRPGPKGAQAMVVSSRRDTYIWYRTWLMKRDVFVSIQVDNAADVAEPDSSVQRSRPHLTVEQTTTLAYNPAFTLTS
jgi:hypothetical protein